MSMFDKLRSSLSNIGSIPQIQITFSNPNNDLEYIELLGENEQGKDEELILQQLKDSSNISNIGIDDLHLLKSKTETLLPLYKNGDNISGTVDILLKQNMKQFSYDEISIYLIGMAKCDQISKEHVFKSEKIKLSNDTTDILYDSTQFDFIFKNVELERNSFYGSLVVVKYLLRCIITYKNIVGLNNNQLTVDSPFIVINNTNNVYINKAIDMQVGVDDCLHLQFHYNNINLNINKKDKQNNYLTGYVKIINNRLLINTMQIQLLRRELIKTGISNKPELINTEILGNYEIMDGFPHKGEIIPIRMALARFNRLNQTVSNKQYTIKYYANLGLIDQDGRRYFKTCELKLYKK